ncbi:hypothetical protein BKA59DRAFT_502116 [Fusarium tricinctum]|uniref:Chromo domain-containing protein n=1 Tax=Fusarium tricinctum TaxID=61284 RepID=A0A8K0RUD0_9HYPO|nr:hypothetical protein BKA59DRAFT_502116 [Fusarium tricinctum]
MPPLGRLTIATHTPYLIPDPSQSAHSQQWLIVASQPHINALLVNAPGFNSRPAPALNSQNNDKVNRDHRDFGFIVMVSPNKDPYDYPVSPFKSRDMAAGTPSKDDGLVHRERPDAIKGSPVVRSGTPLTGTPLTGTPRAGTPRVTTPRTGTPKGLKVSTPKTGTPVEKRVIASAPDEPEAPEGPKSKSPEPEIPEQNGETSQPQLNGVSPEKVNPGFKEDVAIEEFVNHRVDPDNSTVDIQVKWEGGETSWEPEWSLQEQVPALVFKYWDKLGGREAATNLDIYHAFKILKRTTRPGKAKGDKYMYQVQWVGYRATDSTWEQESKMRTIAPGELEKFEAKLLASGASTDKRKTARGPGRPRKKPRVED